MLLSISLPLTTSSGLSNRTRESWSRSVIQASVNKKIGELYYNRITRHKRFE
jgi:hypothetical protein